MSTLQVLGLNSVFLRGMFTLFFNGTCVTLQWELVEAWCDPHAQQNHMTSYTAREVNRETSMANTESRDVCLWLFSLFPVQWQQPNVSADDEEKKSQKSGCGFLWSSSCCLCTDVCRFIHWLPLLLLSSMFAFVEVSTDSSPHLPPVDDCDECQPSIQATQPFRLRLHFKKSNPYPI